MSPETNPRNINWYRTKVDAQTLKELNERDDTQAFIQAGGHLLIMVSTGALSFYAWQVEAWGWLIAALFLHGTVTSFCINGVHELVHGTVFKTKGLNEAFAYVFSFFDWINHHMFWRSHTEHHKFTLHQPDDREVVLPVKFTLGYFFKNGFVGQFWLGIPNLFKNNWKIAKGEFEGEWNHYLYDEAAESVKNKAKYWSAFLLVSHGGLLVYSILSGYWILPIIISFSSQYGGILFILINNTQHTGLRDSVPDFRLCCRTIKLNPVFRFLYWQMNYHTEHHMFAAVPCYKLARLHECIKHELPPSKGLLGAWAEIAFITQEQEVHPEYQYTQNIPGKTLNSAEADLPTSVDVSESGGELARGDYKIWQCSICAFIYDEAKGMPEEGIAPGTRWEDIPEDWSCPDCGIAKSEFEMLELKPGAAEEEKSSEIEIESEADADPIVVIGSGLAGYNTVKEIRKLDKNRKVVMVTKNNGDFYSKPILSNVFTEGKAASDLVIKEAGTVQSELNLEIRANSEVKSIDVDKKTVEDQNGTFAYSKLVLACGANQIRLPLQGSAADEVLTVNDLDSYHTFRGKLPEHGSLVIIGAGLIGCEFANDLVKTGYRVHVVDIAAQPLSRLVPADIAVELKAKLESLGVQWHMATGVDSVDKDPSGKIACKLADGQTLLVDTVLSAVGLSPELSLAKSMGLDTSRGIVVDEKMQSSAADVYAIGDCAEIQGQVLPFVMPIMHASKALAQTLLGRSTAVTFPPMPVVVKTQDYPLVILPPKSQEGNWETQPEEAGGLSSIYKNAAGEMEGFVLAGEAVSKKQALVNEITQRETSALKA